MLPRETSTLSILVVEDDDDLRDTVITLVKLLGYKVVEAADTDVAKTILESDAHVDVLFSDVITPGAFDGVELARWAVDRRPGLKVLLTTGYDDDPDRIGEHYAPLHVLFKPYQRGELANALTQVLALE